jgi:hypothetical protein
LKPSPTEDQPTWCTASLDGSATMAVTLEVYEDDRGAWLKSEPVETIKKQIGGCTEPAASPLPHSLLFLLTPYTIAVISTAAAGSQ